MFESYKDICSTNFHESVHGCGVCGVLGLMHGSGLWQIAEHSLGPFLIRTAHVQYITKSNDIMT